MSNTYNTMYIYTTAECVPDCQNGGVCTEPDVCNCSSGWHGDRCQIGIILEYICVETQRASWKQGHVIMSKER